ncbi:glycoside hydrolase family 3 N-terminal domain-containing protein [Cytophagaceae bacterium ABcell3]|nr:glycoside hydrolase family 3 N-terminal domain-containing protein [Cytophagaceae bacterium ABcell3]
MPGRLLNFAIVPLLLMLVAWEKPHVNQKSKPRIDQWVDSVMSSMTAEQRIGQLFMVAAYSNKDKKHTAEIEELITKHNLGGLIFFQGGPYRQAVLTNRYQSLAKVPLLIAMDAEWGLSMRLDSTISFPKQMTLGAIEDNKLVYTMGSEVARQCNRLGVHVNFAPVVDINSNPRNPIIGMRSFGEDKKNVALKGIAYMKGMQNNRVMANAKHFPGHGDTGTDSHLTLPVIMHSKERLSEIELFPFRELIKDSIMSIMVAHIHVPAYDNAKNKATTLSKYVVTDLLKNEMKFKGLVFTDALNMKGVSNFYKPGEVDVLALLAGNDVLLYAEDVPLAIKKIATAIKNKEITQEEIDERVRKILRAKYWAGLDHTPQIDLKNLYADLNDTQAKAVQQELFEKAITLVKNDHKLLPIKIVDTASFASVSIGIDKDNAFQKSLDKYAPFKHYSVPNKYAEEAFYDNILKELLSHEVVVVGLHNTNPWNNKDYGITENSRKFIEKLHKAHPNVVLSVFANPYSLKHFDQYPHVICGFEDNETTNRIVPQIIFGALSPSGKLPVTVSESLPIGTGLITQNLDRLRYGQPESVGLNGSSLAKVDSIFNKAIEDGATPGGQVLIAKDGMVVYNKSFGHMTYDREQPVTESTIYDIASITKVAGTMQAVMFLHEKGLLDLNQKASYYLPELKNTNKADLIVKDILGHQAGLVPFIPYWKKTMDTNGFSPTCYARQKDEEHPYEVVPGVYSIGSIEDSLWKWTVESDMLKKKKKEKYRYVYSDLGFYIMKRISEKLLNQPINEFLQQNFYDPMGMSTMGYNPLCKFEQGCIAPTEDDKLFRRTVIRGTVHDQGAAMLGGVAGHAGLFSNANDLAILLQMHLQKGRYGGYQYFKPETIERFTKKQFDKNRRGLGWDKPEPDGGGPTSDLASPMTYGHTGFTGTAAWVDPEYNLIYIFLSNRVCPDANNTKLIKNNVRTVIQDQIYNSILEYNLAKE